VHRILVRNGLASIAERGEAPTLAEIGEAMGLAAAALCSTSWSRCG
jgi:hypothetical protein